MVTVNEGNVTEVATVAARMGALEEVEKMVDLYYPGLAKPVLAELAVFGAMSLAERTKPLSLIFEAGSGTGKTAVVQMAFVVDEGLKNYVYRCDKFTPKSFVSHAANQPGDQLVEIDLLPKLRNKVLITKELAPIFRGRTEYLTDNFSVLIAVLDGKGFTSDSGMRGQRGYQEPIVFNWIGATTPLPKSTHRLMSQLGTRLLFYEIPPISHAEDVLLAYALKDEASKAENECSKQVNKFLAEFYRDHPIGTVEPDTITISEDRGRELVRWGNLLVKGRAEVKYESENGSSWQPISAQPPEGPFRVIDYFKELARGHALINERTKVDGPDLELIEHIAISSVPGHLRPIVRQLRRSPSVDSAFAQALCNVSRPTARNYLKELSLLGIAELTKGSPERNQTDEIRLSDPFRWLRT